MKVTSESPKNEFELDHLFIMVSEGAPEADLLVDFGLTEGSSNIHPGQGTRNRRFFFPNACIELLWVHDAEEAKSETTLPTGLWERWHRREEVSPFGICIRSWEGYSPECPFAGWDYKPSYLPREKAIQVGKNSVDLREPMIFMTPFGKRPGPEGYGQPTDHPSGLKEISSLRLRSPRAKRLSPEASFLHKVQGVEFLESKRHTIEIGFDRENEGKSKCFSPHLPLIFRW